MERGMETLSHVDAFNSWQAERSEYEERIAALREEYQPLFAPYQEARGSAPVGVDNPDVVNAVREIIPKVIGSNELDPGELLSFLEEVGQVPGYITREAAVYAWHSGAIDLTVERKWKVV